jgi:endonuclease G
MAMDDVAQHVAMKFSQIVHDTKQARSRVRHLVATGRWKDAEPDAVRALAYAAAMPTPKRNGAESVNGATDDFQPASFLPVGAKRARAVAFVEVSYGLKSELGSGFMISESLFMTNCHVIENAEAARGARITFDRELDELGRPRPTTSFVLDPDKFALFSSVDELDYAVIAVGERQAGPATLAELGFCPISNTPDRHRIGMNCNIVEHPNGWMKMIAVRNNLLTWRTPHTLLYETDTDNGSSGSPVFNDNWELVALHHWGSPHVDAGELPDAGQRNVNEGIRISAIFESLAAHMQALDGPQRALLSHALSINESIQSSGNGRSLSPPRPASQVEAPLIPLQAAKESTMTSANPGTTMKFTIPIEITVSVPGLSGASPSVDMPAPSPSKTLQSGAESVRLDQDYSNRKGYVPDFIAGFQVPLPEPSDKLSKQVAPLRPQEESAASGELKYEHFSLKLNKVRRIAIFTATNIDGATYLTVDRDTGKVKDAEGDTWFKDPRVSASFYLDQSFYSAWSTYFDRGHLTRRSDPTWGTSAQAERANADTFHFSNCSPQHFLFNESAKYWQGLERYVLENGLIAAGSQNHICVIQGPIFDDKIDLWADDVQIPSSFFKIVSWMSINGPKSVGLVVDQLKLLSMPRHGMTPPADLPSVDVNHWRVAIADIEKKTELDFGQAVRDADTIAQPGQPSVGEALRLIKRFADIKL